MESQNHTILVVEDEVITGIDIRRNLEKRGYAVLPVIDDGALALETVDRQHPDLVLMDIHLRGEMDGITAAEQLLTRSGVPVIYLTATADDATIARAMSTAPYGYLLKPFNDRELYTAVETALHRHSLEKRLRESEARYRTLYNTTPAMLHSVAPDGTIISVNDFWLEKMEYTRSEVLGRNITEFMSEESRIAAFEHLQKRPPADAVTNLERQFVTKFGSRIDVLLSIMARDGDSGPSTSVVMQDVTETIRVEKVLANERTLLAAIIETIPYSIYAKDTDHRFILANSKTVESLGAQSARDVIGKTDADFMPMKFALQHRAAEEEILRSGRPILARDFVKRDQETNEILCCLQTTKVPFYDVAGTAAGIVGMNQDVTGERRTEDILRLSEERYRRLFEESKDGIFILAHGGRFIDVNQAGIEMFGYRSKDELVEIDLRNDVFTDPRMLTTIREEIVSRRFIKDYELVLKKKDGKPIITLVTATTLRDAKDGITGYLGFVRDITGQRQIEMQLMHAQKMESVGTLAGGIAHDFNNVLSMILSAAELMKKAAEHDMRQKRYCEMIAEATARGTSIARQLLVFARSEQMDLKPLSVSHIVDEILGLMEHTLPKTITITKQYAVQAGIIMGDSGHLHQALLNLAINAKDAMPAGGDLVFSITNAEGSAVRQKFPQAPDVQYVALSVSDSGMGMDLTTQSRIFEPFFSTKERGKGTGLGLAIVHGIVKSHNGFIDVRSKLGQGTTFTMYFPTAAITAATSEPLPASAGQGGSETILIVDDEQFIRDTIRDILSDYGYNVIEAVNGVEALQIYSARKEEIALVITDLGMPGISGEELFVKLQQLNPDVKAIVSTGYLEHLTKHDMLEMGVLDVIQKPFNISQILNVVRGAIDGPRVPASA